MISTDVVLDADGIEDRTFECITCGHIETRRLAADPPVSPPAAAGTDGELEPPE
ncbi:hypothetical protein [Bradyrhizobium hipponense]|uniref:hypothetical protein n=1 Tax=Bradyrhizobium hipponense TaxID=2605638 RepID=UPI0016532D2D|nr:hypothetical protein [Bradyrhizobium hipponense]